MLACEGAAVCLGGAPILAPLDLSLGPSGLVGVIGPNGAGKSTLARLLAGLVPAAGGRVLLDGGLLDSVGRQRLAQTIAFLPQGAGPALPLRVGRLVALGRLPHRGPFARATAADRAAVARAIARADLEGVVDRPVDQLSGGERARALLARALAVEAPALIADEPLAALDPGHQMDVMALLKAEAGQGRLVVVILHDLHLAARWCDRLVLIDRGRLVADGRPAAVLTARRLAEVYGIRARIEIAGPASLVVPLERTAPCRAGSTDP